MKPSKFADAMERIGFRPTDNAAPAFALTLGDLSDPVFKKSFSKLSGEYRVASLWFQDGEIAFWAHEKKQRRKTLPFPQGRGRLAHLSSKVSENLKLPQRFIAPHFIVRYCFSTKKFFPISWTVL
jgi:hypothetical protein